MICSIAALFEVNFMNKEKVNIHELGISKSKK